MSTDQTSWVTLRSEYLNVQIDPLGAQLSVLRDRDGRDLLWDGNPAVWNGRAPWLFPIVGTLAAGSYRVAGKTYLLPRHGFARGRRFTLTAATAATAAFRLRSDSASLEIYPFSFELEIRYALSQARLDMTAAVYNIGTAELFASLGYHPAFRWPLPYGGDRAEHRLHFVDDEPDPVRRLNSDGLLSAEHHPTPIAARRLTLRDELFRQDVLILDRIHSRSVTYGADAGPVIRVDFPDTPYLGLWSRPGAGFICIEPWHGLADPAGFAGELRSKPGVFAVQPGKVRTVNIAVTLLEP